MSWWSFAAGLAVLPGLALLLIAVCAIEELVTRLKLRYHIAQDQRREDLIYRRAIYLLGQVPYDDASHAPLSCSSAEDVAQSLARAVQRHVADEVASTTIRQMRAQHRRELDERDEAYNRLLDLANTTYRPSPPVKDPPQGRALRAVRTTEPTQIPGQ